MISEEAINRGGSKLEVTRALLEAEVDIPIPRSTWKYYSQDLDSVRADFEALRKPVIVRGSHRNDYHGFIDVIPTHKDVNSFSELELAIKDIEKVTSSHAVRVHSEDWGQSYTPEVHVLIQEQGSTFVGSMLRHPHTGNLHIQYTDVDRSKYYGKPSVSSGMVFKNGNFYTIDNVDISKDEIEEAVEMYLKLEASSILDTSYSQHVEFGLRPLMFYQARPFKKFNSVGDFGDFQLPHEFDEGYPIISSSMVFGITPEEGIELQFIQVRPRDLYSDNDPINEGVESYGLILTSKLYSPPPTGKRFGQMKALASASYETNFLFHENYRLVKKADISLIGFNLSNSNDLSLYHDSADLSMFGNSRVFSNGYRGVIIPTQFL